MDNKKILELVRDNKLSIEDALAIIGNNETDCTHKCVCKKSKELTFDEIVDDVYGQVLDDQTFDINSVFDIMMEMGWTYCAENGDDIEERLITKEKIKDTIKKLITQTLKDTVKQWEDADEEMIYSKHELGGFYCEATNEGDTSGHLYITVGFVPYLGFCLTPICDVVKSLKK